MKKLEDIPKQDFFSAPETYFDTLPTRVAARIAAQQPKQAASSFYYVLRYAVPVVVLTALGIFWFTQEENTATVETMLAAVGTEELIDYLAEVDVLTHEEFTQEFALNAEEASALEETVFGLQWQDENLDDLLDEMNNTTL